MKTVFSFFLSPSKLEQRLGFKFKDKALLKTALSHKSAARRAGQDNETLEFLGDAVLSLALSDLLMEYNPKANEGQLSKMRSSLVSTKGLYQKALEIGLRREMKTRIKAQDYAVSKIRLLASCLEAVIGAVYLDRGYLKAKSVIHSLFHSNLTEDWEDKDYKTLLQAQAQRGRALRLHYELIKSRGPAHKKTFFVRVRLNKKILGQGRGPTKKDAEQQAAFYALKNIKSPHSTKQ